MLFTGDNILFWTNFLRKIFNLHWNLRHSSGSINDGNTSSGTMLFVGKIWHFGQILKMQWRHAGREISNIISYFRSLSNVMLASSGVTQVIFYTDLTEMFDSAKSDWKEPTHQIYLMKMSEKFQCNYTMIISVVKYFYFINFSTPNRTRKYHHLLDSKESCYIYILIPS